MREARPPFPVFFRRWLAAIGLAAGLALGPLGAGQVSAQMASLVADRVLVEGAGIRATGNVVVFYEGVRLTATEVVYDSIRDSLDIVGPITLTDANGTLFMADAAELSADLKNGVLESARVVLDQQLQIAAAEINRVSGRYTQMTKVIASSCQVCLGKPVPLWAIRSSRVVHDQQTRQLYFYDAQLRFMDIPIFYLPRLRLPDPTVERASGFLIPHLRSNSQVGTGLQVPYFLTLGDHADLLLTPFVSAQSRTLGLRYRQRLRLGGYSFEGAVSSDSILPGAPRYYLFGSGAFDLPGDFRLSFTIEQVSDAAYLADYGFADRDRLDNDLTFSRARRDQFIFADLVHWQTLRASEIPIADQLPFAQADMIFEQRFQPGLIGGEAVARASASGHVRESGLDVLGRDQARVGLGLQWHRDWRLPMGLVASADTALAADFFSIADDSNFAPQQTRTSAGLGLSLALPMARVTASGAREILEPRVQLAWSATQGAPAPNDDSVMVEFDPANLFDLSRFPGADAVETGLRANIGLTWSRVQPDGLSFTLAGGKVLRLADAGQFSAASGLDGVSSDWLLAGQLRLGDRLFAQGRALIADDLSLTRAETLLGWKSGRLDLSAGQVWVIADAAENRPDPINEWTLSTNYRFNDFWAASFDTRYDAVAGMPTKADLGLEFKTECITIDLSLSRRFASSGNVTPSTDVGVSVALAGFGGTARGRSRACSG